MVGGNLPQRCCQTLSLLEEYFRHRPTPWHHSGPPYIFNSAAGAVLVAYSAKGHGDSLLDSAAGLFYFGVSYEPRAFFFYDLDQNTDAGLGWDPRRDETSTHWQLKWIYPLPNSKFAA